MTADATGYLIAGLAIAVSIIGWRSRHLIGCLAAAGLWVALWYYIDNQATLVTGGLLQIVTISCFAMAITMLLLGVFRATRVGGENESEEPYDEEEHGGVKGFIHRLNSDNTPKQPKSKNYESPEEYRDRVHRALHPRKKRRPY